MKIGRVYVLGAIKGTRPRQTAREMYRRDLASLDEALGKSETPTNGE